MKLRTASSFVMAWFLATAPNLKEQGKGISAHSRAMLKFLLPNVQDEPPPWLARLVLLGERDVTAMVVLALAPCWVFPRSTLELL
jgi:hypothetical protein